MSNLRITVWWRFVDLRRVTAFAVLTLGVFTLLACAHHQERDLAEQLLAEGRWDEAVVAYRKALKHDPFNTTLQQHFNQAKTRAAEEHYSAGREHASANRISNALQELRSP